MKKGLPCTNNFNWSFIPTSQCDLSVGAPFTEEEVKYDVDKTINDKTSGPDGFSRHFFRLVGA
jgi:hypothetical protein